MLHFGAAAQAQFNVDAEHLADSGLDALAEVDADDIQVTDSDMTVNLSDYGLEYTGSTLVCRTNTIIRHYYRVINQDDFDLVKDNITINGEPVQYKEKDGEIYFEINNIAAADLDTDYTLRIGTTEYKYSVMHYVKRAVQSNAVAATVKNLATALYRYNQAANAYFGR